MMIPLHTVAACLALSVLSSTIQSRSGGAGAPAPTPSPQTSPAPRKPAGDERGRGLISREHAEDLAEDYFALCDYNADNFITFKEAQPSLGLDRDTFAAYDVDRDGRISASEFRARYERTMERGGAFPVPTAKPKSKVPARRTPEETLQTYDRNLDHVLDAREVGSAFDDYRISDLVPATALEKLDKDGSKALEASEIPALLGILDPAYGVRASRPRVQSVLELFGQPKDRDVRPGTTPLPPQIAGPVSAFRRLDLDGNGTISMQDLVDLQRPIQLPVRVNALLATLDLDRNGVISEAEFWASMTSR